MVNKWNGIIWGMRGVSPNRNTKFIFLVNGHKMNHESRDGAVSELDLGLLTDIERVEVIRGPAGVVYGSGAIAGVINLVTKEIKEDNNEFRAGITNTGLESFGTNLELNWYKKINKDFKLGINIGYRISEGVGNENSRIYGKASWPYPWYDTSVVPPIEGVPSTGATWSTPGNFKLGLNATYKKLKLYGRITHQVTNGSGWFPVELWPQYAGGPDNNAPSQLVDGQLQSPDGFYGKIQSFHTNRRQYVYDNVSLNASYEFNFSRKRDIHISIGFDGATNRIQRQNFKAYNYTAAVERGKFIDETFGERRYNIDISSVRKSSDRFQLAYGYQFRLFDLGKDLSGKNYKNEISTHPIISNIVYTNHAVFSEGMYNLSRKLFFNFGLRYDVHTRTIQQGGVISPKIALIKKLNSQNCIKLIAQSSANNGSADNYEWNRWHYSTNGEINYEWHYELPFEQPVQGASSILPPAPTQEELHNLKPERTSSLELATVHDIGENFFVSSSFAFQRVSNLFIWDETLFREFNAGNYDALSITLEASYATPKLHLSCNHTFQRPIVKDINAAISYEIPVFDGYDSVEVSSGVYEYSPSIIQNSAGGDSTQVVDLEYLKSSITADGRHFSNLATHVTKFYMDYKLSKYFHFHTNSRIFWGLRGRKVVHDGNPQFPYLQTQRPIVKWNLGCSIYPSDKMKISLMVYDLLAGSGNSRHAIRWQQMGNSTQTDLYTSDIRTWSVNVMYKF